MVTRQELLEDDKMRIEEEKKKQKLKKIEMEKRKEKWLKEDIERAKTLVDNELGQLIKEANTKGLKYLKITDCKVYKSNDYEAYELSYEFDLGFKPNPSYEPTKILVRSLKKAGFDAKAHTVEVGNTKYKATADGYDIIDVPGTHPEYYLIITW